MGAAASQKDNQSSQSTQVAHHAGGPKDVDDGLHNLLQQPAAILNGAAVLVRAEVDVIRQKLLF